MKNKTQPFANQYPYLNYWINKWGRIEVGQDYDSTYSGFLKVIDEGGVCFECDQEDALDTLFAKAEKYLREIEFPDRFDKKTIATLEEDYKNRD